MSGIFAFPGTLADHPQRPVAGVLAEVGGAGLIDAQRVVQQSHRRRGA